MNRIGLWNLEPKIENTALMQVSQFHKQCGDQVEFYSPLFQYDKVYVFSLFSFTKKPKLKPNMIAGGTGFNVVLRLPLEIEQSDLDYSIYPNCNTSYIWFSRGCIRSCPFCIVHAKEGNIQSVEPKNLNPNGKYLSVMDNNFFANPKWREAVEQIKVLNHPVHFPNGIDLRILDQEQCEALQNIKLYSKKRLHIAWDNPRDKLQIERGIDLLTKYIKPYKIMCYVLIGFWSSQEEDLIRVEVLREKNIDPFIMPYNKSDPYQKAFARWVNHKAIFKSVKWKDYNQSIRFK